MTARAQTPATLFTHAFERIVELERKAGLLDRLTDFAEDISNICHAISEIEGKLAQTPADDRVSALELRLSQQEAQITDLTARIAELEARSSEYDTLPTPPPIVPAPAAGALQSLPTNTRPESRSLLRATAIGPVVARPVRQ